MSSAMARGIGRFMTPIPVSNRARPVPAAVRPVEEALCGLHATIGELQGSDWISISWYS